MAKLEFDLRDSNGNDVEIGDEIIVIYPEIEIYDFYGDTIEFYRPKIIARARIMLPPSKGLQLKILEIITVEYIDEDLEKYFKAYSIGERTSFRYTTWHWEKHE